MATLYNSNFDVTIPFSDVTPRMALATNVVQSFTIPGERKQKYQVIFGYNSTSNVFVGYNVSPTVPAPGTIDTGGNVEFKPDKRYVKGEDVLYFITPDASAYVGISLRAIPG